MNINIRNKNNYEIMQMKRCKTPRQAMPSYVHQVCLFNYIIFMDNHFIGSERTPSGNCIENHLSPLSQEKLTCFLLKRNNLCPFYSDLCLFLLYLKNVIFQTFWPSKENAEHSRLEENKGNSAAAKSHIWICILILQCWPNIFSY